MRMQLVGFLGTLILIGFYLGLRKPAGHKRVARQAWSQAPSNLYKATGTVASTDPAGFALQTDAGVRLTIVVPNNAILVRVAPEEKTLKNAAKIGIGDIAVGDRVLVQGQISGDQKTLIAVRAIDMSKAAIAQKHASETAEWQRGIGGLVNGVDPVASTVTITTAGFGGAKKITIHVAKDTTLRRYSPDSIKFDDANPAPLPRSSPATNFALAARAAQTEMTSRAGNRLRNVSEHRRHRVLG